MTSPTVRFPLSSEHLELLLAFERTGSLRELSEHLGKDQSVVSRQLQRLGEEAPVIQKVRGKWSITPLGVRINQLTLGFVAEYEQSLGSESGSQVSFENSVLLVINAQKALLASKAKRSNPSAEKNIQLLLDFWRKKGRPIIHVQHLSDNPQSDFYHASPLSNFMTEISPVGDEQMIQKMNPSSFANNQLEDLLRERDISTLVLVGFTANDCIEATARDSFEKGFTTYIAGDCTAMFDFVAHDQKVHSAQKMHELIMANIELRYGQVKDLNFFLGH